MGVAAGGGPFDEWTMNDFLVACLVMVAQNPEAMLKRLRLVHPPAKKGRRPRKSDQP